MDINQNLQALSTGNCIVETPAPITAVVVQNNNNGPKSTCATPTKSFTIDPDNILVGECSTPEFVINNTTGAPVLVRFGGLGLPGEDSLQKTVSTVPLAVDSPGALSTDYPGGAQANAIGIQYFNLLAEREGVYVTAVSIQGATGSQLNHKIIQRDYQYDQDSQCKVAKVAPLCDECFNTSDEQSTRVFRGNFFADARHSFEYVQDAAQVLTYELTIAASDSAKNYTACNNA